MTEQETGSEGGEKRATGGCESFRVAGDRVIATLKELIHEGNVRHVVIKNEEGRTLIEFPVSVGLAPKADSRPESKLETQPPPL